MTSPKSWEFTNINTNMSVGVRERERKDDSENTVVHSTTSWKVQSQHEFFNFNSAGDAVY